MTETEELRTIKAEVLRLARNHPAQLRRALSVLAFMSPKLATILKGWTNQ